ncbi:MAG: hypothetical protein ACOVNS_03715 [Erythrobacter sp.]|jgi:hypothetical protein
MTLDLSPEQPAEMPKPNDAGYAAACAMLADSKIGVAMERICDGMSAIHEPRLPLTQGEATAASELRRVLADLAAARALLAQIMVERGA